MMPATDPDASGSDEDSADALVHGQAVHVHSGGCCVPDAGKGSVGAAEDAEDLASESDRSDEEEDGNLQVEDDEVPPLLLPPSPPTYDVYVVSVRCGGRMRPVINLHHPSLRIMIRHTRAHV